MAINRDWENQRREVWLEAWKVAKLAGNRDEDCANSANHAVYAFEIRFNRHDTPV